MSELLNSLILFATKATAGTLACIVVGTIVVYIALFGKTKKPPTTATAAVDSIGDKSRAIERDVKSEPAKSRDISATDTSIAKTTNLKKEKDSDASVKSPVKSVPFLAQYEATNAKVLRDAAAYKPEPVSVSSKQVKSREINKEIGIKKDQQQLSRGLDIKEKEEVLEGGAVCVEPFLAKYEATTAMVTLEAQKYVASMPKVPKPFLAAFEATTATTAMKAREHIATLPKAPKPFLAAFEATTATTALEAQEYIAKMPKAPKPFLAAFEATTATTAMEARKYIAKMPKAPKPFLAAFEATTATTALVAQKYVASMPKPPKPFLAAFEATTATTALEAQKYISSMPKPPKPFLAAFEATTATTALVAQKYVASMPKPPKPFLAAFEATTATTALEAQEYIAKMPKAPKPFLAAFEATTATTALVAQKYVASMPKPPKPFLAAFEATTATTALQAQKHIAAMPKPPKPFLAAFEATTATTALKAQEYIASMPKAPKPFLAAFETTTATCAVEAKQHVQNLVSKKEYSDAMSALKSRNITYKSTLVEYEATAAKEREVALNYIAKAMSDEEYVKKLEESKESAAASVYPRALKMAIAKGDENLSISSTRSSSPSSDNLSQYELTTASNISASRGYIQNMTSYTDYLTELKRVTSKALPAITTNLASLEATTAYQLLKHQQTSSSSAPSVPDDHQDSSSSEVEPEVDDHVLSSPSVVSSISSTTSVDNDKSRAIVSEPLHINTAPEQRSGVQVSWDEMYAGSKGAAVQVQSPVSAAPFKSSMDCAYYPNCTNKNCKFVHPGNDNNPKPKRAKTLDSAYKRPWTKAERIEKQSQTHFPTWKSRCVHWPYCTNNHCKYSHPIKECRMGEQCTFKERCMFLHPSDYMEPVKKRHVPKKSQSVSL